MALNHTGWAFNVRPGALAAEARLTLIGLAESAVDLSKAADTTEPVHVSWAFLEELTGMPQPKVARTLMGLAAFGLVVLSDDGLRVALVMSA